MGKSGQKKIASHAGAGCEAMGSIRKRIMRSGRFFPKLAGYFRRYGLPKPVQKSHPGCE